jgi:HEPN domain-containing protein
MKPNEEAANEWLEKAERDLQVAMLCGREKFYDAALFHCQQAAEKALKGFLAFHDKPIEKTHRVERLLEQAKRIEPKLAKLKNTGLLSEYAVLSRYPDSSLDITKRAYTKGLSIAKQVTKQVLAAMKNAKKTRKKT